jgi:hypothetical protein
MSYASLFAVYIAHISEFQLHISFIRGVDTYSTVPQRLSSMFLGGVESFVYFPHCTVAKFIVSDLGES